MNDAVARARRFRVRARARGTCTGAVSW
jgi:hypothetical protein